MFIPVSFLCLKETYAPVLLEKKAKGLAKANDEPRYRSKLEDNQSVSEKFKAAIIRPLKLLITVPIVTLMAFYAAVVYGMLYLLIATFTFVFQDSYGFDQGTVGLTFLPAGIGMMIGVATFGPLSDFMIRRAQATGKELVPEIRVNPMMALPCATILPLGLFLYGWAAEKRVHFIVPMLGVVFFSIGLMGVMVSHPTTHLWNLHCLTKKQMCSQNYLLDTFPRHAASVTAAITVLRSLLGALLPLGGLQMYNTLGLGWGNSLLAFIAVAMIPIPLLFFIFGARIRKRSNLK